MLALLLVVVLFSVPVPYVELVPGPIKNTIGTRDDGVPIISIKGHRTYPTSGELYLTTVGVQGGPGAQLSLGRALLGWWSRRDAVVPQDLLYPPGQSQQQVDQASQQEMADSQQHAITAALRHLGIPVTVVVTVAEVVKGAPADGRLRKKDVIARVDGSPVRSSAGLRRLIGQQPIGSRVTLGIRRAGRPVTVALRTAAAPDDANRPIIGVGTNDVARPPFDVSINLQNVGGPSAGLMFAVGIIDKLTPGELNGGQHIAGTGTISDDGTVGPIGGIQQKVAAARAEHVTVFLTPAGDCAEAVKVRPDGLTLARVSSLQEALDRLSDVRAGRVVPTC